MANHIRDIAQQEGVSLRKLAEQFNIPYRTVQDWAAGKRTPPDYVINMIEQILSYKKKER